MTGRSRIPHSTHRAAGFSLAELMVSMVVGLLLLAGVVQMFVSNKQTYRTQEGLSRLQENGRFALDEMMRTIQMAGYNDPATGLIPIGPRLEGTDAADTLTVRFEGGSDIADCLGELGTADTTVSNTFQISGSNLQCTRERFDNTGTSTGTDVETLVEGVDSLQLLYGEDLDGDDVANRYTTATDVGDWGEVVSVRIGLLMRTGHEVATQADTATYTVLDQVVDPADDRRYRRILTTTIAVRNKT